MVQNICLQCGKPVKNKFCNPSCAAIYRHKHGFKGWAKKDGSSTSKGHTPWNKGLTKDTDTRLKNNGINVSKKNKGRLSSKKGKTFEELYGNEKSKDIKQKIKINTSIGMINFSLKIKGKTYEERFGIEKSEIIKDKLKRSHLGKLSHRKGKSLIEEYGEIRALEIQNKIINSHLLEDIIRIYPVEFNKQIKYLIKKRDQCCRICGSTHRLSVHHIDYDKNNILLNNLILLCVSCHMKTNFKREYWKEYFKNLIKNAEFFRNVNC